MPSSIRFGFEEETQVFWFSLPGFEKLLFSPAAELDGEKVEGLLWKPLESKPGESLFQSKNASGVWTFAMRSTSEAREAGGGGGIEFSLEAQLDGKANHATLKPLCFQPFAATHLLCHGRAMGSCSAHLLASAKSEPVLSTFWIAITRGASTLHLSHRLEQDDLSHFSGQIEGGHLRDLEAATVLDPCRGTLIRSETVTITACASEQGHELMFDWAKTQAPREEPLPVPQESGWNTWDYYRWTITEEEVFKNAEFIAADPILSKHIKRIIIDDGWQHCYGEWEANFLFPSGMEAIARRLNRMGFAVGLWIAPTIVEPHSRIAQLEPEMLAMNRSGVPCLAYSCMERKGLILDPTREKVRDWWTKLFGRYAGYGYRYFKLDFLAITLHAPRFADASVPKGSIVRRIIEPIRKAVGEESRILGCGYNFEGGVGLVDDARISSDIHANWEAVKENVTSIAARFWSHRRFWVNDADFALCRGGETSDDPDLHRLKPLLVFVKPEDENTDRRWAMNSLVALTEKEAEVLLSLVIVSGGAVNLSDNLARLNAKGLGLLHRVVSAEKGNAALPLDLFRSEHPSHWVQKLDSGVHRVLLINWTEEAAEYVLDVQGLNLPTRNVRDFWSDQSVPVCGGQLSAVLPPHSCLLAELKN